MSAYGTSAVRRRSTRAALATLDRAILEWLDEQQPATVRGVYYQMTVQGLAPKTDAGYRQVQRRVLDLRRTGELPWGWITDGTRIRQQPDSYTGLADALANMQRNYRRDLWASLPTYVEIWCEKDALSGVLYRATSKWNVPLLVSRGQTSDTFAWNSAQEIAWREKPAHVYLFTDYDAAGLSIDSCIREKLARYAPDAEIHFTRAALSLDQIREMRLPTREPKPRDREAGMTFCCELDAVPPNDLARMCEELIASHIPPDLARRNAAVETEEIATLSNLYWDVANPNGGAS